MTDSKLTKGEGTSGKTPGIMSVQDSVRHLLRHGVRPLTAVASATACSLVLMTAATALASQPAQARVSDKASDTHALSIPSQPLSEALKTLSATANEQLLFSQELVAGKQSVELEGQYTTEQALDLLLKGSGLQVSRTPSGVLLIRDPSKIDNSERTRASTTKSSSVMNTGYGSTKSNPTNLRLAQADNTQNPETKNTSSSESSADDSDSSKLQEVVVTAQKREEKLQNVPISISVLGGDDIDRSTDATLTDALGRIPGVSFTSGLTPSLAVRGVTAQGEVLTGGSAIAYYLDSVPFGIVKQAVVPDPDVYDLDRVEVLRGPQGTLYGANALNGVVRILTKDANLDNWEFKARGLTSSTESGGWNYRGDMAVNMPIVEGKLAARAVASYQDWSGWIDSPNASDINDAERRSMRLKINAQPTDQLSVGLSAWTLRSDVGAPPAGFDSAHTAILGDEPSDDNYDIYGLTMSYEFPSVSFTSMTSYLEYDHQHSTDISDIFGLPGFFYDMAWGAQTFAQEINLASTHEGAWRWSAGGMYRDSRDTIFQDIDGLIEPVSERDVSESYAVFGELTRLFLDGQWEFTAGLRYFEDSVAFTELSRSNGAPPEQLLNKDSTFSATTKRFALTWHATEQLTAYASYGEGFRSGAEQMSDTLEFAPEFPPVEPDKLKNYEVGAKGSLWNGRVNFDTALYYIDWKDVQLLLVVPTNVFGGNIPLQANVNGTSASGVGIDFALTTQPIDRLTLGFNAGWNDLTVDSEVHTGLTGRVLFAKGDRVGLTPEYTAGAWANYDFPFGSTGFEGRFSISANYTSEKTRLQSPPGTAYRIAIPGDSLLLARTSLSIRTPNHWTAAVFVDNLTNEDGVVEPSTLPDRNTRVRSRTVGVQLDYQF